MEFNNERVEKIVFHLFNDVMLFVYYVHPYKHDNIYVTLKIFAHVSLSKLKTGEMRPLHYKSHF